MRIIPVLAAAAVVALCLSACATAPAPAPEPVAGTLAESTVTASATVESVDLATRHLKLRDANGRSVSMIVPEEVRNLPQVKVGDEVVVAYHESIAYEVKKPGDGKVGVSTVGVAGRAKEGEKPGAGAGRATTVTVTIEAIDKDTPAVTLKGPDGDVVVVKVRDRAKLDRVAVGDLVEITYTEAVAASVQPKQ